MADRGDEERTIQGEAKECRSLFTDTMAQLSRHDPLSIGIELQDELGRFNLWAGNIGVFAPLQASLDFRLIDVPDIRAQFLRQLDTLSITLIQFNEAAAQAPTEENEDLQDEDVTSPAEYTPSLDFDIVDLVQSVHVTIDWLHRLSNLVRKASFGNQNQRAARFPLEDEAGNDVTQRLVEIFKHLIKRECGDISDQILNRLAQTMIIRRRRVLYRRSRQKRWALQQEPYRPRHLDPSAQLAPLQELDEHCEDRPSSEVTEEIKFESKNHVQVAPSRLTVTTLDEQKYKKLAAPSRISRATTAPFQHNEKLLVPPRPHLARDGKEFVCDYCCLILPSSEAADQDTWANHVKKDLDPYICVFDDCDQPYQIFSSSKEWLAHMRSEHRMSWRCVVRDHPPQTFETSEAFLKHMELDHPGKFRKEQLPFIAESSARALSPTLPACAFCAEESGDLENHVAQHLHHFALQSLPWPENLDQGSEITNGWEMNSSTSEDAERETLIDDLNDTLNFTDVDWLHDLNSKPEPLLDTPVYWSNIERIFSEPDKVLGEFAARRAATGPIYEQREPETLDEELLRVRSQLPGIIWNDADMDNHLLRVSLRGPWGFQGEPIIFKVEVAVPHAYPEAEALSFAIEQDEHMPEVVREMLQQNIHEICQLGLQQKRTCLAEGFSYLLGARDLTSSIDMFNVERGNANPLGDVDEDKPPASPLSQPDFLENSNVADDDKATGPDKTEIRPKSGYLTKRGKNFGSWKSRFYLVEGPQLKYYDTGTARAVQRGSIKLQGAQIGKQQSQDDTSSTADTHYNHALLILEPKGDSRVRHVLCAESDEERDLWVEALLPWTNYEDSDEAKLTEPGRSKISEFQPGTTRSSTFLIQTEERRQFLPADHFGPYVSVASASIGNSYIDCKLNVSKTEFGIFEGQLAGIIYMDISIAKPQSSLQNIIIMVTLDDEGLDLVQARQAFPGSISSLRSSDNQLRLTEYYEPKNKAFREVVDMKSRGSHSKPEVEVVGVALGGDETEYQSTWNISGRSLPGKNSTLHRTIRWKLSKAWQVNNPGVSSMNIHTGFVFQGGGQPFCLAVEIEGKSSKLSDRIRQTSIQLARVNRNSSKHGKILLNWENGPFYRPLDSLARALSEAIYEANEPRVPAGIPVALSVQSIDSPSGHELNAHVNSRLPLEEKAHEKSARPGSSSDFPFPLEEFSSTGPHPESHEHVDTKETSIGDPTLHGSDILRVRFKPQERVNVEEGAKYIVTSSSLELHSPTPQPKRVGFVGQPPGSAISHAHEGFFFDATEARTLEEDTERWDSNDLRHEGFNHFDFPFKKHELNNIEEEEAVMESSTTENRVPSFPRRPTDKENVPSFQQLRGEETGEVLWVPGSSNFEMGVRHFIRLEDIVEEAEEEAVMESSTTKNRVPSFPRRPTDKENVPSFQQLRGEETGEVLWVPGLSNFEMGVHHPIRLEDIVEEAEEDAGSPQSPAPTA